MTISSVYIPFTIPDTDGLSLFVHHWDCEEPKAIVVIAHGMMEHAKRYADFAGVLNANAITVFAPDHRGHGRTADETGLGLLGNDATWKDWIRNLDQVIKKAQEKYPDLPVFLLGHSMGSFIAQAYAATVDQPLQGLILSGTTEEPRFVTRCGMGLASMLMKVFGKHSSGKVTAFVAFFRFCKDIKSPKTVFDWITSDSNELQLYINDPLCGQTPPASFFYELFSLLNFVYDFSLLKTIPKELPLFLYSGTKDPLSGNSKRVKSLATLYRQLGHQVSETYYENGRHEMHHEIAKDEVIRNVVRWIMLRI